MRNVFKLTASIKRKKLFGILLIIILVELVSLIKIAKTSSKTAEQYALEVIRSCKTSQFKPTCYENYVVPLLKKISLQDTFHVVKTIQNTDTSYVYCHVLAHRLGQEAVKSSTEDWKDVAASCPSTMCAGGCLHGVFLEHFRQAQQTSILNDDQVKAILPELKKICLQRSSWNPTILEQMSCYHALGHLSMYITNGNIEKSIELCDNLTQEKTVQQYKRFCYDGSFMQIYQPLEPEDYALLKGKRITQESFSSFCDSFAGYVRRSCVEEAWPLFYNEISTPDGLLKHCSVLEENDQLHCFLGMVDINVVRLNLDEKSIITFCEQFASDKRGACFGRAARRLIEIDTANKKQAVHLCMSVLDSADKQQCMQYLISVTPTIFQFGTDDFYSFCALFPSLWQTQCKEKKQNALLLKFI